MIKSSEEIIIYESPDGGKTVYSRKSGDSNRTLSTVDDAYQREQRLSERWVRLKEAVFMAESDITLNDAISKVEMLYALKKKDKG